MRKPSFGFRSHLRGANAVSADFGKAECRRSRYFAAGLTRSVFDLGSIHNRLQALACRLH